MTQGYCIEHQNENKFETERFNIVCCKVCGNWAYELKEGLEPLEMDTEEACIAIYHHLGFLEKRTVDGQEQYKMTEKGKQFRAGMKY